MNPARPANSATKPAVRPAPPTPEFDFPNCDPIPMTWRELERYDGRIEYWDATLKTAWVLRDGAGFTHEVPCSVLGELLSRLSQERGSRVRCYGHAFLMVRNPRGRPSKVLCADQTIYLSPRTFRGSTDSDAVVVGADPLPDVVLEVDHTTEVRRAKLGLYESWGFPEVWVETPDAPSKSRPRAVLPGLTIHILDQGSYRTVDRSVAFPAWKASSIHRVLKEERLSPETLKELARLGRAMGSREGTGPDDDPQLAGHRRWAHHQGLARGRAAGLQEGRRKGLEEGLQEGRRKALDEQRALLRTLVEQKFDAATAREFDERVQAIDEPERLREVAGWIITSDHSAHLLSRLA